jgi:hypothetical protein
MATTRPALAQLYSRLTGLDYHVALGQLNAENSQVGHGTNPLGVRCGNSKGSGLEVGCDRSGFAVYRSSSDGIRAAAWLLLHGSHYGGVRQAIAGGTPAAQRLALINSGWAAGGYHGGTGFSAAGISGSAPSHAGPVTPTARLASTASTTSSTTAVTAGTGDKVWTTAELFRTALGVTDDHVVTPADVSKVLTYYGDALRNGPQGAPSIAFMTGLRALFTGFVGRRVGSLTLKISNPSMAAPNAGDTLPNLFGDLFAWVPSTIANLAVLAAVLGLGYLGIRRLVG